MWQDKIQAVLKSKEMTQEELAIDADLSQSAVSAFLSGRKNPSLNSLIKMTTALDMTLVELFSPIEPKSTYEELSRLKLELHKIIESAESSQLHSLSLLVAISKKILR
ncbi:hypothetical protein TUM4438_10130 [Shewanella sairae]|uniref:HTH cro/C1-type domain-containing protein n=1 Tax=Shewanella sairae TaxID=190310 RepID=A0ABQ4P5P2_9GAMM|nr:helix-turn-helix transcriptional regulator [Shewanella sairae]MCL1130447.1 helix-turn-helix transcriptional regulator [Shewanella sairae]GIU42779.1 hypothetical protein TUM4438_10130 [Shewanella sairae]